MTPEERYFRQLASQTVCGIGSIIVPPDVDRQTFIDRCFSTETVSVLPQTGGLSFNNVPVSLSALQYIEFPVEGNKVGSTVVYLFHPKTNKPIVIAVLSNKSELYGVEWKQFKHFKSENGNYVSVVGDGRRGNLYITVAGTEESSGGQIFVSLLNNSNTGVLRVSVQGDILLVHNNFKMTCVTAEMTCKDKFEVITDDAILNAKTKVSLGKENYEPVVLGNKLKDDIIKPLLDALKKDLTVSTAMGPSGPPLPAFVAKIVEIETKLDSILSQKVETE